MQVLIWIVRIVVILLIVWFAARNAETVELKGFLDSSLKAPLVLILLAFFGGGLLMGLLASLMTIFQLKREVRKLNRALQHKAHETSTALPPVSGNQNNA
jgi:uncharacterized integral membrane protein